MLIAAFTPCILSHTYVSGINLPNTTQEDTAHRINLGLVFLVHLQYASPLTRCGIQIKVWQIVTCWLHFTEPHRTKSSSTCFWLNLILILTVLPSLGARTHSSRAAKAALGGSQHSIRLTFSIFRPPVFSFPPFSFLPANALVSLLVSTGFTESNKCLLLYELPTFRNLVFFSSRPPWVA